MNKAISFVKLDIITVKPYMTLKNLIILICLPVFLMWANNSIPFAAGIIMVFGALFISYPFAVGEKNGIDALYATLSIARNTVVLGRYLFALTLNLCTGTLGFILAYLSSAVLKIDFQIGETVLIILVLFAAYSIVHAFQLPIYFKLGYTKAKFSAYIPLMVLPLMMITISSLIQNSDVTATLSAIPAWIDKNSLLFLTACVLLWIALEIISYRVSLAYYRKRDF